MTDVAQEFLEALRGRLQSLDLAGATLIPRLLPPATAATATPAAPTPKAPGSGPAPANGHSWTDVVRQMKDQLGKAAPKHAAAKPASTAPAPVRPASPSAAPAPAAKSPSPRQAGAGRPAAEPAAGGDPTLRPSRPVDPKAEKELADLAAMVAKCDRCKELARTRTQTVFCSGPGNAEVMFIGEAPGEDEDRQGEAFVGRAGQLLTRIITAGMKMRRQDVYICNILKCRPPGNRKPQPDEAASCREYLDRQIELVAPKVICLLGGIATQFLLDDPTPVGQMRGRWFDYRGIPVRVTYHPAYLLRSYTPDTRKKVWDDVLEVVSKLKELRSTPGGPKQPPPTMF